MVSKIVAIATIFVVKHTSLLIENSLYTKRRYDMLGLCIAAIIVPVGLGTLACLIIDTVKEIMA